MDIKPLVSIIIPVYNQKKYLNDCMRTVINQTYSNLEILLIDDGSTDGSAFICDKWEKKDKRISVIHKKNGGVSETRNIGLCNVHGKYICFIDSDDWVNPRMIENMVFTFENYNSVDLVFCQFNRVYDNSHYKIKTELNANNKIELFSKDQAIKLIVEGRKITNYLWSGMYRKDLITLVKFPEGKNYEDMYTMINIIRACRTVALIDEPLYFYRINAKSITHKWTFKNCMDYCDASVHEAQLALEITPTIKSVVSCKVVYDMLYVWKKALVSSIDERNFEKIRYRIIAIIDRFYPSNELANGVKVQIFILKFVNRKKNGLVGCLVNKLMRKK